MAAALGSKALARVARKRMIARAARYIDAYVKEVKDLSFLPLELFFDAVAQLSLIHAS